MSIFMIILIAASLFLGLAGGFMYGWLFFKRMRALYGPATVENHGRARRWCRLFFSSFFAHGFLLISLAIIIKQLNLNVLVCCCCFLVGFWLWIYKNTKALS